MILDLTAITALMIPIVMEQSCFLDEKTPDASLKKTR